MSIYLNYSIYISILWVFEFEYSGEILIFGPRYFRPEPFKKIGEMSSSGMVELQEAGLVCESKGGAVAEEGKC